MHSIFRPASRSHLHLAKIRAHVMHINIILKPVSLHFVAHLKVWKLMSYLLQIFRQNSGMVTNSSVTIDWERNKSFYSDCVRKSKERSQLNHLDCGDDTIRKLTRPFALSTLPQFSLSKTLPPLLHICTIVTVGQKERRNEVFLRYGAKEHIVKKLGRKIFRSWSW